MITIYTNEEYSKSYTELLEILKYFSKSDLIKIPKNLIKRLTGEKKKKIYMKWMIVQTETNYQS